MQRDEVKHGKMGCGNGRDSCIANGEYNGYCVYNLADVGIVSGDSVKRDTCGSNF